MPQRNVKMFTEWALVYGYRKLSWYYIIFFLTSCSMKLQKDVSESIPTLNCSLTCLLIIINAARSNFSQWRQTECKQFMLLIPKYYCNSNNERMISKWKATSPNCNILKSGNINSTILTFSDIYPHETVSPTLTPQQKDK